MSVDLFTARAEALFASTLSACEPHDRAELEAAIAAAVRHYRGVKGCAELMAAHYADRPVQAAARMQWARESASPLGRRRAVSVHD